MKRIAFLMFVAAAVAVIVGSMAPVSGQGDGEAVPIFGIKIPPGYRDWRLVSLAHEAGNLNSLGAVLGNDIAIKAYRDGKLPFPDGTIIAALHYGHIPSEENNKIFGDPQSFVPGPPTNIQFMVKDSKKFATTGGWGFAHFDKEVNLAPRQLSKPAPPATRKLLATSSSHNTRPDIGHKTLEWRQALLKGDALDRLADA